MSVKLECVFPGSLSQTCRKQIRKVAALTIKALPKTATNRLKPKKHYSLSISVVGDLQMKKLNKAYRGKNKATDVLSFSQLEGAHLPTAHLEIGEVVLSLPTAKRQAKEYGFSLENELARLTIHGVLHLFGYDHEKSKKEERRMFRLQDKIFESIR